jgi:hypothetical protein
MPLNESARVNTGGLRWASTTQNKINKPAKTNNTFLRIFAPSGIETIRELNSELFFVPISKGGRGLIYQTAGGW